MAMGERAQSEEVYKHLKEEASHVGVTGGICYLQPLLHEDGGSVQVREARGTIIASDILS